MELPLTPALRLDLMKAYKSCKELKLGNRLNMVLLLDDGYSKVEVAKILKCDEDTVAAWRDKFLAANSIGDFKKTHYHSPACRLLDADLAIVKEYILNSYITKSSQLIEYLFNTFKITYSSSGVRKLLNRMGFSYKQLTLFPGNADANEQVKFVDDYYKMEAQLPHNEAIMFLDAAHPIHNARPNKTWSLKGVRDYIRANTGRHRVNINGAYDPQQQIVVTTTPSMVNADTTIELLEKIKAERSDKVKIHLYADNAMYYRSRLVQQYLAENPVFVLRHLPPYSPNLNLIERLWKFMRDKIMNAKYYETAAEFEAAIVNFFTSINTLKPELKSSIGLKLHLMD